MSDAPAARTGSTARATPPGKKKTRVLAKRASAPELPAKPADTGRTPIDPKAYNEIVAIATLRDLRLVSSRADIRLSPAGVGAGDWEPRVADQLDEWGYDDDGLVLWGRVAFKAETIAGSRKPVVVEATYHVGYAIRGTVDGAASEAFLKRVARFAAYPYFRAYFSAVAGQASLVLPPLPVLKEPPRAVKRIIGRMHSGAPSASKAASKDSKAAPKR